MKRNLQLIQDATARPVLTYDAFAKRDTSPKFERRLPFDSVKFSECGVRA